MHVITGGAYNGKSKWVKAFYQLEDGENSLLISAYQGEQCPTDLAIINHQVVVLEGMEQWTLEWIEQEKYTDYRKAGRQLIQNWLKWESAQTERKLIIIGADISKGIVPMESDIRAWRDITGWFYQDLVKSCQRFDVIWYGIHKQLK